MIHQLRLTYLRTVDDPYASRLLSFNQRHLENPHVLAAGLADPERWPQLKMPSTPKPAPINIADSPILSKAVQPVITPKDELPPRWVGPGGGTGGASLKYTTTIMGPTRTGALGMRTNGHRLTTSAGSITEKRTKAEGPVVTIQDTSVTPSNAPAPERPIIAPHFSRNAEMEAKRKARIEARNALAELRAQNHAEKEVVTENIVQEDETAVQEASSDSDSEEDFDDMGAAPDDDLDL
jgi:target of rapamycin complex 2 subunit MAPKAP1